VLSRYDRLSADFVVALADTTVVCVIELDDASHELPAARARDRRKEGVLSAAGITLLLFRATRFPTLGELTAAIHQARADR
jgi:very-short-patch-repair endonuclease